MSYSFDGAGDTMTGTYDSMYAGTGTIAVFFKYTGHPGDIRAMLQIGANQTVVTNSLNIRTEATADRIGCRYEGTPVGSGTGYTGTLDQFDNVWTPVVFVNTSNVDHDIYVGNIGQTSGNATDSTVSDALKYIRLGELLTGSSDFTGKLAEPAHWRVPLTTQQITDYLSGISAAYIQPSDLIGYWPLSSNNATQANLGIETAGDLTVTGATYDSDHPIITAGGSPNPTMGRRIYILP